MIRSVLVPLDGSTFAEAALPLGLSIARRAGASIQLVRVHVPQDYDEAMSLLYETLHRRIREDEQTYLDEMARRLSAVSTVQVTTTLLAGMVADCLHRHATSTGADLVVMSTHGRGRLSRFWLGSVADDLLRRLPVPLLLVRPDETTPDLAKEPSLRHVLIPLDGSELAEQILEPAMAVGALTQAEFTLFQVVNTVMLLSDDPQVWLASGLSRAEYEQIRTLQDQKREEAQRYLEGIAARLRRQSLTVHLRVAAGGQPPAAAILDYARDHGVDLIALATHGRSGLARLFLGSVADKVVRGATTPVLVQRPRQG